MAAEMAVIRVVQRAASKAVMMAALRVDLRAVERAL